MAVGLNHNAVNLATVGYKAAQRVIDGGGYLDDEIWLTDNGCRASFSFRGVVEGTSFGDTISGKANSFIVTSDGKVLVNFLRPGW